MGTGSSLRTGISFSLFPSNIYLCTRGKGESHSEVDYQAIRGSVIYSFRKTLLRNAQYVLGIEGRKEMNQV